MVQPIWPVLAELEIEGEYCESAIAAVERVSTQPFQIVIIDWDDQPDALSLLKTVRDLKAAQRPLTLAIVSEEALPAALQAGANSVLVKPIRAAQVLETLSTACELLRSKQQPARQATSPAQAEETPISAAASAGTNGPASVPLFVVQAPEKAFRAGEFLQSPNSAPSEQFDTECVDEVQKSLDQAAISEVDALTELEPMAAEVQKEDASVDPPSAEPAEPQEPLTGWASLQARIMRNSPQPVQNTSANSELLGYGETPSYGAATVAPAESSTPDFGTGRQIEGAVTDSGATSKVEPASVSTISHESSSDTQEESPKPAPRSKQGRLIFVVALAACAMVMAVPSTRRRSFVLGHSAAAIVQAWLNPPPPALPQPEPLHDSFGQAGDEFKLPASANIPDATTDPSQIRVEPVVDPTAKPDKSADANAGTNEVSQGKEATADSTPMAPAPTSPVTTAPAVASIPVPQVVPQPPARTAPPPPVAPAVLVPVRSVSAGVNAGIPSSLKSQIASSSPDASGPKPPEAAMSSIEPVVLPEAMVLNLLAQQPVQAEYPARANGQRGSVVLQVLIGRDGTVQDAKFLQGSLVFARAAIDAVKQWQFKPYSLNGRAVSVQSSVTLNFKPPA
ncbi:MAG: TonB family protein [Candidatus Sulfotelmatobacter sp.]